MKIILLALIGMVVLLSSCKVMYVPTMQNVPMFQEKGEVKVSAGYRNYQFAATPLKNFAIMANGSFLQDSPIQFPSLDQAHDFKRKTYSIDGAIGTYRKIKNNQSFEIFAGMGWGYGNINFGNTRVANGRDGSISNFYKYYIQPNWVISQVQKNRYVGFAFSGRLTYVDFYNFRYIPESRTSSEGILFVEPAATLKFGMKGINLFLQTQFSYPLKQKDKYVYSSDYDNYTSIWLFSGGLEFQLNKIFGRKKSLVPDNSVSMF